MSSVYEIVANKIIESLKRRRHPVVKAVESSFPVPPQSMHRFHPGSIC